MRFFRRLSDGGDPEDDLGVSFLASSMACWGTEEVGVSLGVL